MIVITALSDNNQEDTMNFIQCASAASVWKGYYYYEENRALVTQRVSENIIRGTVSGSSAKSYSVEIDLAHPKRSKCNCPHADGKLIICKHKVALYFTVFPKMAKQFYDEAMFFEEQEEQRQQELSEKVVDCVRRMKKNELQQVLLELLFEGPEWQLDRFVGQYIE